MHKSVMVNEVKKCLKCGTFHNINIEICPASGRYIYTCGSTYQPKKQKNKTDLQEPRIPCKPINKTF